MGSSSTGGQGPGTWEPRGAKDRHEPEYQRVVCIQLRRMHGSCCTDLSDRDPVEVQQTSTRSQLRLHHPISSSVRLALSDRLLVVLSHTVLIRPRIGAAPQSQGLRSKRAIILGRPSRPSARAFSEQLVIPGNAHVAVENEESCPGNQPWLSSCDHSILSHLPRDLYCPSVRTQSGV